MSSLSKMLFTIADKLFYETLDRYAANKQAFFEPVRKLLPAEWKLDRKGMWFNVTPPGCTLAVQGWKMHASATPANAKTLLERIVPVLVRHTLAFKFALDPLVLSIITGKGWSVSGVGKFVTIYFEDESQFVRLAEELHRATADLEGPYIVSDRRYPGSKVLYYRYGGISAVEQLTAKGERVLVLSTPDGRAVPDERLSRFVLPEWITDPIPGPHAVSPGETPTTLKDGRYRVKATLVASSCGGVYLADDSVAGVPVIIKQARPLLNFTPGGDDAVRLLEKEHRLLKKVEDTRIAPRPLDFFQEGETSSLVEEYIANSMPLRFYSGSRTVVLYTQPTRERVEAFWSEYRRIFLRVASLLQALHQHGIVCMDFSHNNVLISSDGKELKLIDLEGAFEIGGDAPSQLLTPGFVSVSDLNSAPQFAHDYFALGASMLSYIMPVNTLMLLDPSAPDRFLQSITKDFALPGSLERLISGLLSADAPSRPDLTEVIKVLGEAEVTSEPRFEPPDDDLDQQCKATVDGAVRHMLAVASYDRSDRLFPSDPKIFVTNPLSVAYGACGTAWAIRNITGALPEPVGDWLLKQKIDQSSYPPGLYFGMAGIAWVFRALGFAARAEEIMRLSWDHPVLGESPDMFYGLAGWGTAQLKFFLETGNEEYLRQARRAGELLAANAKEESGGVCWPAASGAITPGFAHGASGISMFLLDLYRLTQEEKFLDLGRKALDFDLAAAISNPEGALTWQVRRAPGAPGVPYLRYGSAGVGLALVKYFRALEDPRYRQALEQLLPDVTRKYGIYPGRFVGLAGIGEFLLALRELEPFRAKSEAALKQVIMGTLLFQINTAQGAAFPGYELYRFSCDYATGSAGVGLFLHEYVTRRNFSFSLDEIHTRAQTSAA